MSQDPVKAAMERSAAAMVVLDRHKDAIIRHFGVLLGTFGKATTRNIVAGALEAAIIAAERLGYPVGEDAIAEHFETESEVVPPFRGDRHG